MELIKHHKCLRGAQLVLPMLVLCFLANDARVKGQQLRDVFRSVQPAVVIVKTEQIGLAPFPQQGLVSSDGLGSGVLISSDKVITAAHLVQSADSTVVEFPQGENIRAKVIGCSLSADVALLQLERSPGNYVAAKLGGSDQVAVGDEVFVVGDHDAIVSAKENAYRLKSVIPQAQLIEIEDTGHEIPQTHPESIASALGLIRSTSAAVTR